MHDPFDEKNCTCKDCNGGFEKRDSKLFPYQRDGVLAAEKSGLRYLFNDEMGVGKTAQGLVAIRRANKFPCLVICKASLKFQISHEIAKFAGVDYETKIIHDSKDALIPGFDFYIISFDLLDKFVNDLGELNIKSTLIDEVQMIKNIEAIRTQAVIKACKSIEVIIGLSGTHFMNNATEIYPFFHIIKPKLFPSQANFISTWVDSYNSGLYQKYGGIRRECFNEWMEVTKEFSIRRTRKDVLPDLPSVFRNNYFTELGESVKKLYIKEMQRFQEEFDDIELVWGDSVARGNIIGYLSRMRHITGLAKVEPCFDYITDFLMANDRKITIFVHHQDVGQRLAERLSLFNPLCYTSNLDADTRAKIIEKFWKNDSRILIASTKAGGVGLNLQCCSDMIMLEHQWEPFSEMQCEGRFPRPGQTADKINATYFIATGTIDEFLIPIKERKRAIGKQILDGDKDATINWHESSSLKELAEFLVKKGLKAWKL